MDFNPGEQPARRLEELLAVTERAAHQDDAVAERIVPGNRGPRRTEGHHRAARDRQEALRRAGEVDAPKFTGTDSDRRSSGQVPTPASPPGGERHLTVRGPYGPVQRRLIHASQACGNGQAQSGFGRGCGWQYE